MTPPEPDAFGRLAAVAQALENAEVSSEIAMLEERIDEGRFFVACVGQFKRGKSTLLNALVGANLLPTGVIPVTAIVTVLRYGVEARARVRIRDADWIETPIDSLATYISEAQNPDNEKGVVAVEVFAPSKWLASGMCLVDTPGLGSVFASNTNATRSFVPHIDAALVVLGADPPISGDELELVAEVAKQVRHLVFVINKADRLNDADIAQAQDFTRAVIAKRLGRTEECFVVSAAERLAGSASRDWAKMESQLTSLAHTAGAEIVMAARDRGVLRISGVLAREIEEHRAALLRPVEESARRVEALTRAVEEAERALSDLQPLFRNEEATLLRALESRRTSFLETAPPRASAKLLEELSLASEPQRTLRARAVDMAQRITHDEIDAWARDVGPEVEQQYRRITSRFVSIGNDFLRRVQAEGDLLGALATEMDPEIGLRAPSHFYFTEMLSIASPHAGAALVDAFTSRERALRVAHESTLPYVTRLLDANSSRIIYDLNDRVRESGTKLRSEITRRLRAMVATAQRATERARASRTLGEPAVRAELSRLDALESALVKQDESIGVPAQAYP